MINTVYAGIALFNIRRKGLYKSLGFRQIGIYQSTGYKCVKWRYVAWLKKALAEYDYDTQPAAYIGIILDKSIENIFHKIMHLKATAKAVAFSNFCTLQAYIKV